MENLVGDLAGGIHLVALIFALLFGTMVLIDKKGTKRHKTPGV